MQPTFKRGLSRRAIDAFTTAGIKRGIGPAQRYLVTVAGRKTQTLHTTPVSLVTDGSGLFLVGPYGEVGWIKNARAAGVVTLTRGGQSRTYSVSPVEGTEAGSILKRYLELEPITRSYFSVPAKAAVEEFVSELASHPVFKLTPVSR
jgi:deazaflavin-dependent oxidoreductase (nitroreductase family)